jgi:hypothetical protein
MSCARRQQTGAARYEQKRSSVRLRPRKDALLEMELIFELPAKRFARCGRAHAEQNAGIPLEGAGPDVRDNAEQLGADTVVLRPVRIEPFKRHRPESPAR